MWVTISIPTSGVYQQWCVPTVVCTSGGVYQRWCVPVYFSWLSSGDSKSILQDFLKLLNHSTLEHIYFKMCKFLKIAASARAHLYPSTRKAEADRSLWVQGQPELHKDTLSKTKYNLPSTDITAGVDTWCPVVILGRKLFLFSPG